MSLKYGHTLVSIPGPSILPNRVLNAMHRPSPNIYEGELVDMTNTVFRDLKVVARTKKKLAMYITNGHGVWEAALVNTMSEGDKVLVLETGHFTGAWGGMATALGLDTESINFGAASDIDPNVVEERLRADGEGHIKGVLMVQTDTASSVKNDVVAVKKVLDLLGHPALLMVDCIASLGCDPFEMDEWGVDVMVASSQKGLMTPTGVSFVYYGENAARRRDSLERVSPYWDWKPRTDPEIFYRNFCGTAPTHHLFALREALNILVLEEGIENAWNRHRIIASAVWAAVDAWGGDIRLNITDPEKRSCAVSTVRTGPGVAKRLRQWCEEEAGVTLGISLGLAPPGPEGLDAIFRIGHMGHVNVPMIMGTLGAIDAGLKALKVCGSSGALDAATTAISQSYL